MSLEIPRVLRDSVEGRASIDLDANRLNAVGEEIRGKWPLLAAHVLTESGQLRPHVLLLHNDRLTRGDAEGELRLAEGDRLEIVQAVSGG